MAGGMAERYSDDCNRNQTRSRLDSDAHTLNNDRNRSILLRLPAELLLLIHAYLRLTSQLALRHVCRELYNALPTLQPTSMPNQRHPCEQLALSRINEDNELRRCDQQRCIVCDVPRTLDMYPWPGKPICSDHDGWFTATEVPSTLEPGLRARLHSFRSVNPGFEGWVALPRTYCAHHRDILGWHVVNCKCGASCQFCGSYAVTCFVRVPGCKNMEKEFVFGQPGKADEIAEKSPRGWRRLPVRRVETI